ncbi:MAG TPA: NADH-quinone oxidoreductase subunit M, partial [Porphyromonadaceae bacterium]|nr:NADH-quinone oxidoreductase subunit M [Porphyromonadaceae bacterium]
MEIFNNPLIYFVIIPLLTLLGLAFCNNRGMRAIRAVAVTGAVALVALAIYLVCLFLQARAAGDTSEMILQSKVMWYAPFNIELALGVDGVSVVMILLSAFIVFAGVFASWKMNPLPKQFFLWFFLLSTGVFGFFISIDLFTMFMFYEVALIPMYLLIGVWGSGNKNYSAMKLTLMLMGGSAFLMLGLIGIYFHSSADGNLTMNILEIAHNDA